MLRGYFFGGDQDVVCQIPFESIKIHSCLRLLHKG